MCASAYLLACLLTCSQAISQVRTVYSFVAEEKTLGKYMKALESTLRLGIKVGVGGIMNQVAPS